MPRICRAKATYTNLGLGEKPHAGVCRAEGVRLRKQRTMAKRFRDLLKQNGGLGSDSDDNNDFSGSSSGATDSSLYDIHVWRTQVENPKIFPWQLKCKSPFDVVQKSVLGGMQIAHFFLSPSRASMEALSVTTTQPTKTKTQTPHKHKPNQKASGKCQRAG